jgi:hypothetical protein
MVFFVMVMPVEMSLLPTRTHVKNLPARRDTDTHRHRHRDIHKKMCDNCWCTQQRDCTADCTVHQGHVWGVLPMCSTHLQAAAINTQTPKQPHLVKELSEMTILSFPPLM